MSNSFILSYCRPFSGNDSRNKIKVSGLPRSALKVLSPEEVCLHNRLLQYRNQIIAHSDSQAVDMKYIIHNYEGLEVLQPVRNRSSKCLSLDELKLFENMASKLLSHVAVLRNEMEPRIIPLLTEEHLEDSDG